MKLQFLEILLAAALLALLAQVAAFGGTVFWAGAREASAGAGLSTALYAPFALLALLLPALAAPAARRALRLRAPQAMPARPWPAPWCFAALLGIAEALTIAARWAAGASPPLPLSLHGLLGAHGAVGAFLLARTVEHADASPAAKG